jgi:tight adherence protein B
MIHLIAMGATLLAGILLHSLLRLVFRKRLTMVDRLAAYTELAVRREERDKTQKSSSRGVWQAAGKLAPRAISQRYGPILQQAGVPLKGEEMAGMIGASTVMGIVLGGLVLSVPGWIMGGIAGYLMPGQMLKVYLKKRLRNAEDQLVDFLNFTANAMRAGHSFLQALELSGKELPDPLGFELRRSLREISLGVSVEEALQRLSTRLPSADLDLIVTAVLIQRQVGGDLAGIMDSIASTIRGRQHIKAQVRTLTAQGRLSGWVISGLPFALLLVMNVLNGEYVSLLWKHPVGLALLIAGICSQMMGIFFINKIIQIEV